MSMPNTSEAVRILRAVRRHPQKPKISKVARALRELQGSLTQAEFARETGVSTAYLGDIYHGRRNGGAVILARAQAAVARRRKTA